MQSVPMYARIAARVRIGSHPSPIHGHVKFLTANRRLLYVFGIFKITAFGEINYQINKKKI